MEKILVLDFGGQYSQLIARRVREMHVYAEILPYRRISVSEIAAAGYKGIIFTGGPDSVYEKSAPRYDPAVLYTGIPTLGICYGMQLLAALAGGKVTAAGNSSEYGETAVRLSGSATPLFQDVPAESICWMSHTDFISRLPEGFRVLAHTEKCPCAAMGDEGRHLYGLQFHPEVKHTAYGGQILHNFLFNICHCEGDWQAGAFAEQTIEKYRQELAGKKVLLALSGGVDSSVTALLLHKAIGRNLISVFVDHGLLRKGEADYVEKTFRNKLGLNLIRVDASSRFLSRLSGVSDPESKRKIIGGEFVRVFEKEALRLKHVHVLAQGTIYPDRIESGQGNAATIKSHHNVGGLPESISFDEIVEPLKDLFKDEVRAIGALLGLPDALLYRQPFPGPGLAVRIIGEITTEKLSMLREADAIFQEEIANAKLSQKPDQYFAVLTDTQSVGVKGDARTYGYTVALRAVATDDFMTAEWARLPYEALAKASTRITNEVPGVSRVVYDISDKPPATVEWE